MPIYRYRCNECNKEVEFMQELSEDKPETKTYEHEQIYGGFARQCPGVLKRVYDKFHFHISGR